MHICLRKGKTISSSSASSERRDRGRYDARSYKYSECVALRNHSALSRASTTMLPLVLACLVVLLGCPTSHTSPVTPAGQRRLQQDLSDIPNAPESKMGRRSDDDTVTYDDGKLKRNLFIVTASCSDPKDPSCRPQIYEFDLLTSPEGSNLAKAHY